MRSETVRSVDFCRVRMYWAIGKRISEKEQQSEERTEYGKYIIRNLAKEIEPLYGSGFGGQTIGTKSVVLPDLSKCVHTADAFELVSV